MSRQHSAIIKGLAILLMLTYHLPRVVGPDGLPVPVQEFIAHAGNPVMYFLLVSGYGLYCAHHGGRLNWRYLARRTAKLYIAFWVVLAVFVMFFGLLFYPGWFSYDFKSVVLNLTGWRWDYCQYTWFLLPYVLMSLCSRWVFSCLEKLGAVIPILVSTVLTMGTTWLIARYYDSYLRSHQPVYLLVLTAQMSMGFTIGAAMARHYLTGHRLTWGKLQGRNLPVVGLLIIAFLLRGMTATAVVPGFPVLVTWLVIHLNVTKISDCIFVPLGNQSMMMWFCHGFIATKMFKPYFELLQWPLLVWLVWVLISYCVALVLMQVTERIYGALKLSQNLLDNQSKSIPS